MRGFQLRYRNISRAAAAGAAAGGGGRKIRGFSMPRGELVRDPARYGAAIIASFELLLGVI